MSGCTTVHGVFGLCAGERSSACRGRPDLAANPLRRIHTCRDAIMKSTSRGAASHAGATTALDEIQAHSGAFVVQRKTANGLQRFRGALLSAGFRSERGCHSRTLRTSRRRRRR